MKKYLLIENTSDLPYVLDRKDKFREFTVVTPSVPVFIEAKKTNLSVKKLSFNSIHRDELLEFEDSNYKKILELRLAISDYLNNQEEYRFAGLHHPDFFIYIYRKLLFAFEYRYFLLSKMILNFNQIKNRKCEIYIFNDVDKIKNRIEFLKENPLENYFSEEQRSFSNVLYWGKKEIIKEIKIDDHRIHCPEKKSISYLKKINGLKSLKNDLKKIYSNIIFNFRRNKEVILSDLNYESVKSLIRKEEENIYRLDINYLEKDYTNYKKKNLSPEVKNVVKNVINEVILPLEEKNLFSILDFNYFKYIKDVLEVYVKEEISSLYWASEYIEKLSDRSKIVSAYSAIAYRPVIYSIFKILSKRHIQTFSYPHGAEGYYDFFWQERFTTAAADFRIVGSLDQRKHFEEQQEKAYPLQYHTKFIEKEVSYLESVNRAETKQYDAVYVMNGAPRNTIYTTINYPERFEYFKFQQNLINLLSDISEEKNIKICIRPYFQTELLYPYFLKNISDNIYIASREKFTKLLNLSGKIIIDYPSTSLFQSMELNKKIFCINTCVNINKKLKEIMKNYGVVYLEEEDMEIIKPKLESFLFS